MKKTLIGYDKICLLLFCVAALFGLTTANIHGQDNAWQQDNLTFHAAFEDSAMADFSRGSPAPLDENGIDFTKGKYGKAVVLGGKTEAGEELQPDLLYSATGNMAYEEWTLCYWIKLDKTFKPKTQKNGRKDNRAFFRLDGGGGWKNGDIYLATNPWGKICLDGFNRKKQYCNTHATGARALEDGKWHHMAIAYKNGHKKLWIDGYEVKYVLNKPILPVAQPRKRIRLGAMQPKHANLGGAMDEMRIYDIELTGEQVRAVMNLKPSATANDNGIKPVFYAPFNGKVDGIASGKDVPFGMDRLVFSKGALGNGVVVMRHGYDARGTLSFDISQVKPSKDFTVSFYVIPEWSGKDKLVHGFAYKYGDEYDWEIKRDENAKLVFKVSNSEKTYTTEAPVSDWKNAEIYHIAAAFSSSGKITLAINGETKSEAEFPAIESIAATNTGKSRMVIGDTPGSDRYSTTQANCVIDELRIFDKFLSAEETKNEFARKSGSASGESDTDARPIAFAPATDKENELWDMQGAYRETTATREKVCLNALWRFQITGGAEKPSTENWHYLAVPGRYSGHENGNSDHTFYIRDKNMKPIKNNFQWDGKPTYKYRACWLERSFAANENWHGKDISFFFTDFAPSQEARIWINNEYLGTFTGTNERVTIPEEFLKFGEVNNILIHMYDSGNRWAWRGMKGDVWISATPKTSAETPQILTSVRKSSFEFRATVRNALDKELSCKMRLRIFGENAPDKYLESKTCSTKTNDKQELSVSIPWDNAHLWSYVDPYLYEYELSLVDKDGQVIDQYPRGKFGFREFWIEGGDYFLNGKKIHLYNTDMWCNTSSDYEWCKQFVHVLKEMGYNSLRMPFSRKDFYVENIFRACDEEGLLLFGNMKGVASSEYTTWNRPDTRTNLERKMYKELVLQRNHPSIIMWYVSINFLGYGWDYHPLKQADGYTPPFKEDMFRVAKTAGDFLTRYDPTRPYFMQAGGEFGPVHNSNGYFCWWPLAERMEWPYEWSKRKSKPLHMIETSFPYNASMRGMDLGNKGHKPYFLFENAARYYGGEIYTDPGEDILALMKDPNVNKKEATRHWQICMEKIGIPLYYRLKNDMLIKTVLNWRGADISGICPFAEIQYSFLRRSPNKNRHVAYSVPNTPTDFRKPGWQPDERKWSAFLDIDPDRPTPFYYSMKKAFAPRLVYIGGEESRPTAQDHTYFAGEKVEKCIVISNDAFADETYDITWKAVTSDGKAFASGESKIEIASGEVKRLPIAFDLPDVDRRQKCKIEVSVNTPQDVTADPFIISVYPNPKQGLNANCIALFDTEGVTADALAKRGVRYADFAKLKNLSGTKLVIIGRKSLKEDFGIHAKRLNLKEALKGGDVNILVMAQTSLECLGMHLKQIDTRTAFSGGDTPSEILDGLDGADLLYWRGDFALSPEYPEPDPDSAQNIKSPFWHWTNRNMVCAYPVKRPTAGNFKVHLASGMDLLYSPLLEIREGSGRIMFCQAEVSPRVSVDPAATKLFDNMLESMCKANRKQQASQVEYFGDNSGLNLIQSMGFSCKKVSGLKSVTPKGILLLKLSPSKPAVNISDLQSLAQKGKTIVFWPLTDEAIVKEFGLESQSEETHFLEASDPTVANLGKRDLFFRYPLQVNKLSGAGLEEVLSHGAMSRMKIGKGEFLFMQANPDHYNKVMAKEAQKTTSGSKYFAYAIQKERLQQIWCTVLGDLGCESTGLAERFENTATGMSIALNGKWKFNLDQNDKGVAKGWSNPDYEDGGWRTLRAPGYWEHQGINTVNKSKPSDKGKDYDGCAWYRRTIEIPQEMRGKPLCFAVNGIDDYDWTFVDGVEIGRTGKETPSYWKAPRRYTIPAELTQGKERITIAIRVYDDRGNGGIAGDISISESSPLESLYPYTESQAELYDTETFIRW